MLARKQVGSYDTTIVRENTPGSLNSWLRREGFRPLVGAEDVIQFYARRSYVFACIKVSNASLKMGEKADLHPLRFSFSTGGQDGIYFPMKLTGLQGRSFDVDLYVLFAKWLNNDVSPYGYAHRGFELVFRDFDDAASVPNAGKAWSAPETDPYLRPLAHTFFYVTKLLQRLHPGERYYLTNIRARNLAPQEVRAWSDDLWLFPHYPDPGFVPFDARPGGPASAGYATLSAAPAYTQPTRAVAPESDAVDSWKLGALTVVASASLLVNLALLLRWLRRRQRSG